MVKELTTPVPQQSFNRPRGSFGAPRGGSGGSRGSFGGGRGGFGGGRGGFGGAPQGPPQRVEEIGTFSHVCGSQLIVNSTTTTMVPRFFRPVYFDNKQQIGKVDEIFGPIEGYLFSVDLSEGIQADSFKAGQKIFMDPYDQMAMDRFTTPQKGGARGGRGGARGGRGGDRGGRGGRGGFGGGRGAPRGGFGGGRGAPRGGFGGGRGAPRGSFGGGRGGSFNR